jgi:adenosylcobinamide-GDP ribazoletransferase
VRAAPSRPWSDGLRLALTTFTVAPVTGPARLDRQVGGWAMRFAPLIGVLLGTVLAGVLLGTVRLGAPVLLAAVLTVTAGALLTRGLHLDGLADTVDALGSYRSRERALEIMKSPEVGPFAVVALVLTLLIAVASLTALAERPWPALLSGVVAAVACGRLAVMAACRQGVPAARPGGMGALVAGTVTWPDLMIAIPAVAATAIWAVPGRPWQGPLAVLLGLGVALVVRRHAVRRLGGVTGDVFGTMVEVAGAVTLVVLAAA